MSAQAIQEKFSKKFYEWWYGQNCPVCLDHPELRKHSKHDIVASKDLDRKKFKTYWEVTRK